VSLLPFLAVIVYIGIGVALMFWIRRDNEFRYSEIGDMLAYGSIILWPITALLWLATRPPEQLQDLAAKKTYQDFRNFMKTRKAAEGDFLKNLDKYKPGEKVFEIEDKTAGFQDLHLESLIESGEWQEALRTANDMLRFAREQQEYARATAYERYIKEIKDRRKEEMDKD
jgi:hypothetical protein